MTASLLALLLALSHADDPPPAPPAQGQVVPVPVEAAEPEDESDLPPWPDEVPVADQEIEGDPPLAPTPKDEQADPVALVINKGAYYSSLGLYLPLTDSATPSLGEMGEFAVYATMLSRAVVPRFMILEASVNPLPSAGLLLRRWDGLYEGAQLNPNLNLVQTFTAGFEEPGAGSIFLGNVARFDVKGRDDVHGRAYVGLVASSGFWHIVDNVAVKDPWAELELKLKGDRKTALSQLSWSFRVGTKIHSNSEVTDVLFVGLRRSRLDPDDHDNFLLANSGIEYRFDMSRHGKPLRHYLVVDKKIPLGRRRVALVLGVGMLWEARGAYSGALEASTERVRLLVRPNIQF
ncbi:MAG: hypothetical protein U0229_14195 [Anaeromyxobacter sp.]